MEEAGTEELMYRIGIIDDVKSERDDIQVSILDNAGLDFEIEFKEYELDLRAKEDILREIRNDIEKAEIQALIVDFKLDTAKEVIEGWEIIDFMHEETPEFPVVILTNAPEESKESKYTDADKVYAKKVFLIPSAPETKEMVKNICLNMLKYTSRRGELENNLSVELKKLDKDGENEDALMNIIKIETELSKYKQIYQTKLDAMLDMSELKDAFEQLRQYEKMLG